MSWCTHSLSPATAISAQSALPLDLHEKEFRLRECRDSFSPFFPRLLPPPPLLRIPASFLLLHPLRSLSPPRSFLPPTFLYLSSSSFLLALFRKVIYYFVLPSPPEGCKAVWATWQERKKEKENGQHGRQEGPSDRDALCCLLLLLLPPFSLLSVI